MAAAAGSMIDGQCPNESITYNSSIADRQSTGIIAIKDIGDNEWDTTNNKLKSVATYVTDVRDKGSYIKARTDNIVDQRKNDAAMVQGLKLEYCYYFNRYKVALDMLYTEITKPAPNTTTVQGVLTNTMLLNRRVNALIEVMDYLANERVGTINTRASQINAANILLGTDLASLNAQAQALKDTDIVIKSQKEMVRYTQEKNNHIENQISLWAALNIVAIATIFYVYRKM